MSEQNLLNYNIFKTNDYNFDFPIATAALSDQRKVRRQLQRKKKKYFFNIFF